MTNGTKLEDDRVTVTGPNGDYVVGHYYTKVWSGADNPSGTAPRYNRDKFFKNIHWSSSKPPKRAREFEHPYQSYIREYRIGPGRYSTNSGQTWYESSFITSFGQETFFDPWSSNDDLKLIEQLRSMIQGSDFNLGVSLGEGREALETIANAATRIHEAYRKARKGDFVGFSKAAQAAVGHRSVGSSSKSAAKTAARNWSEWEWGWKPLLKDVQDGAEFLAHLHSAPRQQTYTVKKTIKGGLWHPGFNLGTDAKTSVTVKAIVSEVDALRLSGLLDVTQIGYELLPYSFVVDWFIPIGNFLAALNTSQSLKGTFVRTKFARWRVESSGIVPNNPATMLDGMFYTSRRAQVDRTVSNNLFVPRPSMKKLDKVASWRHAVDAVALLTNKL